MRILKNKNAALDEQKVQFLPYKTIEQHILQLKNKINSQVVKLHGYTSYIIANRIDTVARRATFPNLRILKIEKS